MDTEIEKLTNSEIQSIKVLNFIAEHDGIIKSESEIVYILEKGIEKFISKKRRYLVRISENTYPIRIKLR
jgi:hypothetical protein